ncbi:hypothetical protein JIG36_09290 [Actinoplanes sp. LDG1-06]|uniref:Uncharacterized protein n=1 Tax=Paractinoplanes ovalisporus TaxID=2810368 RepID=A0ABS2A7C6_9ACTN|nr:hypothetical protein [Actinoplanes ovalisporus]MBM2615747.1 hypothetical protein [Actinoplanes ovalisporus]
MTERDEHVPAAVISSGDFERRLAPGESLHFGRAVGDGDLSIGGAPEDLRVPRRAGRLECRPDGVLIFNLSDKRALTVAAIPGPQYEIAPLMVSGTHPHGVVRLSLAGRAGEHRIMIDARELAGPGTAPVGGTPTAGFRRLETMRHRHRLFLCALCLPMMKSFGKRGRVPTYAELEVLLADYGYHYKAGTIRNNLDELRHWLTYEHEIPDLIAEGGEPAGSSRVVDRLAHWAIRSGNVTEADLARFEANVDDDGA